METELYKIRSMAKCTKDAYNLFNTNLKTILRRTWLPVLVFAIITAVARLLYISQPTDIVSTTGGAIYHWQWILACVIIGLLTFVSGVWVYAAIVSLLNGLSVRRNIPRVFRFILLLVAFVFVLGAITVAMATLPYTMNNNAPSANTIILYSGISMLLFVLLLVVAVPAYYSSLKYLIEPEQKIGCVLGKPYRKGWHHWGFLFITILLTGIIAAVLCLIVMAPNYLIMMAHFANLQGVSMGDASGLPSYFEILAFFASLISDFIYVYLMTWAFMVYYYAYGSIEAKLRAKTENTTMLYGQNKEAAVTLPEEIELK
jgi:hypothetical protein